MPALQETVTGQLHACFRELPLCKRGKGGPDLSEVFFLSVAPYLIFNVPISMAVESILLALASSTEVLN